MKAQGSKTLQHMPYIKTSKEIHSTQTNVKFEIRDLCNCNSKGDNLPHNTCTHCYKHYFGKQAENLKRLKEHLYKMYKKTEVTGQHYSLTGHSH
jgi:hypothetical protein